MNDRVLIILNSDFIFATNELGAIGSVVEAQNEKVTQFTAFIQKPWTADALIQRIRELDAKSPNSNYLAIGPRQVVKNPLALTV
ncbi:MAG: hypothetical protein HQ507_12440 [Candidatus Marinimicrobia bacterium]|nr:hypothetical protein [Candidatus Neomarinimicrobiota bacterium]